MSNMHPLSRYITPLLDGEKSNLIEYVVTIYIYILAKYNKYKIKYYLTKNKVWNGYNMAIESLISIMQWLSKHIFYSKIVATAKEIGVPLQGASQLTRCDGRQRPKRLIVLAM